MRSSKAWIIALLIGALSIGAFFFLTKGGNNESTGEVAQQPVQQLGKVVVVKQDVSARTEITAEMVEVQEVPAEYIHPMAVLNIEDAVTMISLIPMNAGEQLLKTKIADPNTNYLSYKLKEGYVAFTVAVSELTSAGGMIRVGDKVNVMGDFGQDIAGDEVTEFFMYDIPVIAIGQDMSINSTAESADTFSTMTLEVKPEDAQKLSWAQNHGSITFILKSVMDKEDSKELIAVNAKTFFGEEEEYQDLEYVKMLEKYSNIRNAETNLLEFGKGDVQHIRDVLDYDKLYYDDLNPKGSNTSVDDK